MPRLPVRCLLFFSSYFPLSLIYCFVLFEKHRNWAIVSLLIGLISLIGLYLYFWFIAPKKTAFHEKIIDFHRHDGDIMSYIASYIVPFISISLDGLVQLLSVGVFIFVLFILYVSSVQPNETIPIFMKLDLWLFQLFGEAAGKLPSSSCPAGPRH